MKSGINQGDRWQTLDVVKTIGCLGAFFVHILAWQFGKVHNGAGITLYDMNAFPWQILIFCFIIVHILFLTAGASFYFYIEKHNPSTARILSRLIPILLIGCLFGLNYHPLLLYWNVFFFYSLSILVLYFLHRFLEQRTIFIFTLLTLFLTPWLRIFFDTFGIENYFTDIFLGNAQNSRSFYPFFPYFSLIGLGFFASYVYEKYGERKFFMKSLLLSIFVFPLIVLNLEIIDVSDIFGATAHMPVLFLLLTVMFFVFLLSSLELILTKYPIKNTYNPFVIIGRHILPVYVLTLFGLLIIFDILNRTVSFEKNNTLIFPFIFFSVSIIAYGIAVFLTRRANKKK